MPDYGMPAQIPRCLNANNIKHFKRKFEEGDQENLSEYF